MRIAAVASAFPKHYYRQEVIRDALKRNWETRLPKPRLLDQLHALVGVKGRYLALPIEEYEQLDTWGKNNDAWIACAQELGSSLCAGR
jgi:alkylresorcinol/alkylpyrone synthase